MMRFEFLEAAVRLAINKYIDREAERIEMGGEDPEPMPVATHVSEAIGLLVTRDLLPHVNIEAVVSSDVWRKNRLYTEVMDDFLLPFLPYIESIFFRYAPKTLKKGLSRKRIEMDLLEWLGLLDDLEFIDTQVGRLVIHIYKMSH